MKIKYFSVIHIIRSLSAGVLNFTAIRYFNENLNMKDDCGNIFGLDVTFSQLDTDYFVNKIIVHYL